MTDESGHRDGPRVTFAARVQLKVPNVEAFVEYFAQNLSEGGIFVQTRQDLDVDRSVYLRVIDPHGHTLFEAQARVKWRRDVEPGVIPGVGLEFLEVPPASQRIIEKIVAINPRERESVPPGDLFETSGEPATTPQAAGPGSLGETPDTQWPPLYEPGQPAEPEFPVPPEGGPSLGEMLEEAAAGSVSVPAPTPIPVVASTAVAKPQVPPEVTSPMPALPKTDQAPSALVLGIDLGTTFSCAAVARSGKPDVILSETGYRTIPSVVTVTDKGDVVVGWAAHDKLATHPRSTIYGSKRLLGRRYQSQAVQDALHYFDYEIVPDMGISGVDASEAAVLIRNKIYPVEWVAARILHEILVWARDHTGENVVRTVIAVPAYYNDHQRQSVIRAAKRAGLEVEQIVNEPTAAALAYGIDRGLQQTIMVYDLGGGTFDVSIMELTGNVFEVLGGGGDLYLGGVDFDNRIVDWVIRGFEQQHGIDLGADKVVKLRIRQAAEVAKRELSEKSETRIYLPYVAREEGGQGGINLDVKITREVLNKLVHDLVERTMQHCARVLKDTGKTIDDLDEVLLVGGQTRMPLVQGRVHAFAGKPPRKGVHPDEAVAIGAALVGESLDKIDSITLLDVITVPIGVALPGGRFRPIIEKNTRLPAERVVKISTARDEQAEMSIDIYQGASDRIQHNDYLGTLSVELPAAPKGAVEVSFTFSIDAQGFLTVTARDSVSKAEKTLQMVTRDSSPELQKIYDEETGDLSPSSSRQ